MRPTPAIHTSANTARRARLLVDAVLNMQRSAKKGKKGKGGKSGKFMKIINHESGDDLSSFSVKGSKKGKAGKKRKAGKKGPILGEVYGDENGNNISFCRSF